MVFRVVFCGVAMAVAAWAGAPVAIPNGDFEKGMEGWTVDKGTASTSPEAVRSGKQGLRIVDNSETEYVRVISESIPATPGATYTLSVWFNQIAGHGVNALLWFADASDDLINPDGDRMMIRPADTDKGWMQRTVTAKAPANAVAMRVHVQSNRIATGATVDFDDFALTKED
jgi:hypothetical protein